MTSTSIQAFYLTVVVIAACSIFFIQAGPLPAAVTNNAENSNPDNLFEDVVYDQRQNGSENLRIHMNDVTLVVAPSDGILQLMGASAADFLNTEPAAGGSSSNPTTTSKQTAPTVYSSDCSTASDPVAKCKQQIHKKNRIRLSSFLMPLLNRAAGGN